MNASTTESSMGIHARARWQISRRHAPRDSTNFSRDCVYSCFEISERSTTRVMTVSLCALYVIAPSTLSDPSKRVLDSYVTSERMMHRMPKVHDSRSGLRVHEFAKKTGVTIRTLHHYDRVGLLKPRKTRHGYRVYSDADAARLDQITVLKLLGLSLTDIKAALASDSRRGELLKVQRYRIGHRRQLLAVASDMLEQIERGSPDWTDLAAFARELGGGSDPDKSWRNRRLSEARRKIALRRLERNMPLSDYELHRDVRTAIARGDTPDTPAGQALVARWRESIERFTGGDPELKDALELVIRDRSNHPSHPSADGYHEYFFRALQQAS